MALMNVAYELISTGAKVLLVDFDLEAPGLDTFLPSYHEQIGVVDFINEYITTGAVPDARNYIQQCETKFSSQEQTPPGTLLIMSAGSQKNSYGANLAKINWKSLYRDREGFLLLEDLKQQWKEYFAPDYVLIDSRTGYTDESGICTRQLPDAVVAMFSLNEQNLAGMSRVVSDIRFEKSQTGKDIYVHAVASNVPDIDDEADVIQVFINKFEKVLGTDDVHLVNHYQSLDLISQRVFTATRPKTRLARQYRAIVPMIRERNEEDKVGVLSLLEKISTRKRVGQGVAEDLDRRIETITSKHMNDQEILLASARAWLARAKYPEAYRVLSQAIDLGSKSAVIYRLRAEASALTNNPNNMTQDLVQSLRMDNVGFEEILMALRVLKSEYHTLIVQTIRSDRTNLDDIEKSMLGKELLAYPDLVSDAVLLFEDIKEPYAVENSRVNYTLGLIRLHRYDEAMSFIGPRNSLSNMQVYDQFNYAVAEWGRTGIVPVDLFSLVLHNVPGTETASQSGDANNHQCFAIAYWAVGNLKNASSKLDLAIERSKGGQSLVFSAWSYLFVSRSQFVVEVGETRKLVIGEAEKPSFMLEHSL